MPVRAARVLIAEEQPVVRDMLRLALDAPPVLVVVGAAGDAWEALRLARASTPDVLTVDHQIGEVSGLVLVQMLRRVVPALQPVVLASEGDPWSLERALRAGVTGYLTKRASIDEVRRVVLAAARGQAVVVPGPGEDGGRDAGGPRGGCDLTPRELDAVRLVALGWTDRQIAERLQLSVRGVQATLLRARRKSGVPRRAALAGWAAEQALL